MDRQAGPRTVPNQYNTPLGGKKKVDRAGRQRMPILMSQKEQMRETPSGITALRKFILKILHFNPTDSIFLSSLIARRRVRPQTL